MASKSKKGQDPDYDGGKRKRGGKAGKDPNAPKRPLSAFFCFSNEERSKVKAKYPDYTVGQIAKELGERWKTCPNKSKFEGLAAKEKERYEEEMAEYKQNGSGALAKKAPAKAVAAPKAAAAKAPATKAPAKAGKAAPAAKGGSKSKPPAKKAKVDDEDDDDDEEDVDEEEEEEEEEESD